MRDDGKEFVEHVVCPVMFCVSCFNCWNQNQRKKGSNANLSQELETIYFGDYLHTWHVFGLVGWSYKLYEYEAFCFHNAVGEKPFGFLQSWHQQVANRIRNHAEISVHFLEIAVKKTSCSAAGCKVLCRSVLQPSSVPQVEMLHSHNARGIWNNFSKLQKKIIPGI